MASHLQLCVLVPLSLHASSICIHTYIRHQHRGSWVPRDRNGEENPEKTHHGLQIHALQPPFWTATCALAGVGRSGKAGRFKHRAHACGVPNGTVTSSLLAATGGLPLSGRGWSSQSGPCRPPAVCPTCRISPRLQTSSGLCRKERWALQCLGEVTLPSLAGKVDSNIQKEPCTQTSPASRGRPSWFTTEQGTAWDRQGVGSASTCGL